MSSYHRIRALLRQIRRRQLQRRLSAASAATVWIGVVLVVLGSVVLSFGYNRWMHLALLVGGLSAIAWVWVRDLVRPALATRRETATASLLERHFPELRSDLTSSLAFGQALHERPNEAPRLGSPALMAAHLEKAAADLARRAMRLERRLPSHGMPWLRKAALGALVAFAAGFLFWPGATRTGLTRFFAGAPAVEAALLGTSSPRAEPLVGRIVVHYRYPSYTRRPEMSLLNPTGRIEVLAGTEVRLEATALRPTRAAALVMTTAGPADAPQVETNIGVSVVGDHLTVSFTPLQNARYTFELVGSDGESRRDPVSRAVTVIPDAAPHVELIAPDSVVQAGPHDTVPFRFTVADDYGLTELSFVHAFAGDETHERRQELVTLDGDLVFQDGAGFDLEPLGLQPRDELLVYVEAIDNDTISGPKAGRSRAVLIRIASPEDRHLALIEQESALFEALIGVLGDYLEHPIADMERTENGLRFVVGDLSSLEYQQRYGMAQQISARVLELMGRMRDLLTQMESDELLLLRDYEILQSLYDGLYELHRTEQNVLTSLSRAASRQMLTRHHMERVQAVRGEQVRETEKGILTLEEVVAAQRMESLVRTLEELDDVQARLRQLLEEYRETQDPALRAEIERELLRLEARMRELLERLAEQMERVPPEHYNVQALQEMGQMGDVADMADALQQIRQMLEAGDIEGALNALDNLDAQIESMLQQLSTSSSSGGGGLSELDQRMSELVDEINNLAAQEADIEQDTGALQEEIRQRRVEALQEGLDQFVQEARERVAEMRRQLEQVDRQAMRSNIAEALSEAEDHLESLDEMLEAQDFESALGRAEQALERLSNAGYQLNSVSRRYAEESSRGQQYRETSQRVDDVSDAARGLVEDLRELLERARPSPDAQDLPRLQELAEAQGTTLEELAEMLERVEEMSQQMPMIGEELSPGLGQVERFMDGAEQQLRSGRVQGARDDEQSALRQLREMRDQMHQMVQRERMGERMGNMSVERVEIPEEPDETPAEFREDILDAMREGSLESYEEAIRRYYESLVE